MAEPLSDKSERILGPLEGGNSLAGPIEHASSGDGDGKFVTVIDIGKTVRERVDADTQWRRSAGLSGAPDWKKTIHAASPEEAKVWLCGGQRTDDHQQDSWLCRIAQTIEDLQVALASQIEITNIERAAKERLEAIASASALPKSQHRYAAPFKMYGKPAEWVQTRFVSRDAIKDDPTQANPSPIRVILLGDLERAQPQAMAFGSGDTPPEAAEREAVDALRELVELKDMHDRIENRGNGLTTEEAHKLQREYRQRRPLAWQRARGVISKC